MVTLYVIEAVIEDDVVTSHIFLTESKAYKKLGELLGEWRSARSFQIIKKQINDESGITEDEVIFKTDDLHEENMNILEEKDKD
jgi:hypothetical protein